MINLNRMKFLLVLLAFASFSVRTADASATSRTQEHKSGTESAATSAEKDLIKNPEMMAIWCQNLRASVRSLRWDVDPCKDLEWKQAGASVQGRALVYGEFGDQHAQNVTLVFAAVHGDEITPVYIGLKLAHWLKETERTLTGTRVIVAPLVNPDGFYGVPRTRVNASGVDVNRNFATRDWQAAALRSWAIRFHKDPRRYPGNEPRSEPETIFQEEMIRLFKPQKIISIHSPLNFLDYDGPSQASVSLDKFSKEYVQRCMQLRRRVRATSSGYFPGSLGNYAGQELGIPTLTLELPTANPRLADSYWKKFSEGIRTAIEFVIEPHAAPGM